MQSSGHRRIPTRASTAARGRKLKKLEMDLEEIKRSYEMRNQPLKKGANSNAKKSANNPDSSSLGDNLVSAKRAKLGEHSNIETGNHSFAFEPIKANCLLEKSTKKATVDKQLRNFIGNSKLLFQDETNATHIRRAGDETKSKAKQAWQKRVNSRLLAPEIDETNQADDDYYDANDKNLFDSLSVDDSGVHEITIDDNPDKIVDERPLTKVDIKENYPLLPLPPLAHEFQIEHPNKESNKVLAPNFLVVLCAFLTFWFFLAIV